MPKPTPPLYCPWCGIDSHRGDAGRGYINWRCGSFQHGSEPWQSQGCRQSGFENALEKIVDLLDLRVPRPHAAAEPYVRRILAAQKIALKALKAEP